MAVDRRAQRRTSPLQWNDLTPQTRRVVSSNVRESGMAASNIGEDIAREAAGEVDPGRTEERRKKAGVVKRSLEAIQPHMQDIPITLQGAAGARTNLFNQAESRAADESLTRPRGYGWYFEHRAELERTAKASGFDTQRVVSASAVMSPSNSPDNEKAAIDALARLHSENPELKFGRKAQRKLGVGESARVRDLTPEQVAGIGDPKIRKHIDAGGHDLQQVARGGTRGNTRSAVEILRGDKTIDDILSPTSAAKVRSYEHNIQSAHPGGVQDEYMARYEDRRNPAQERLDLFGMKDSQEGILSSTGHTAEDTWMNAISSRQELKPPAGTRSSPAKIHFSQTDEYGLRKRSSTGERAEVDPSVSGGALRHAFNNKATQMAARAAGLPSVAMQEVAWTEARIQAGKDPLYAAEMQVSSDRSRDPRLRRRVTVADATYQPRASQDAPRPVADWGLREAKIQQNEMFSNKGGEETISKAAKPKRVPRRSRREP